MHIQSGPNIYESSSVRLRVARLRALAGPIETFDFRAVASHRKLGARGRAVACLEKGIRRSPGDSVGGSATFVGNHIGSGATAASEDVAKGSYWKLLIQDEFRRSC